MIFIQILKVRDYALKLNFETFGNYPGIRSCPEPQAQSDYLKQYIQKNILHQKILHWDNEYNTCYQYTTEDAETEIMKMKQIGQVLYLTPNAPVESGTGIYEPLVDNPNGNGLEVGNK